MEVSKQSERPQFQQFTVLSAGSRFAMASWRGLALDLF